MAQLFQKCKKKSRIYLTHKLWNWRNEWMTDKKIMWPKLKLIETSLWINGKKIRHAIYSSKYNLGQNYWAVIHVKSNGTMFHFRSESFKVVSAQEWISSRFSMALVRNRSLFVLFRLCITQLLSVIPFIVIPSSFAHLFLDSLCRFFICQRYYSNHIYNLLLNKWTFTSTNTSTKVQ